MSTDPFGFFDLDQEEIDKARSSFAEVPLPGLEGRATLISDQAIFNPDLSDLDLSGARLPDVSESMSYLSGLARSALHGIGPGLIGIEPSAELARWQTENPISGFLAEVGASLIPYSIPFLGQGALGLRLTSAIPLLRRLPAIAATLDVPAPGAAAALREIARFLPFETTRVGMTVLLNPAATGHVAKESAIDLVLFGGIGGVFGAFRGNRPLPGPQLKGEAQMVDNLPKDAPYPLEWSTTATPQDKLLTILQWEKQGIDFGAGRTAVQEVKLSALETIYNQVPVQGVEAFVTRLEGDVARGKKAATKIGNFFRRLGNTDDGLSIRKFLVRGGGNKGAGLFPDEAARDAALLRAGIPQELLAFVKFPRFIETRSEAGRDKLLQLLKDTDNGFVPVGNIVPNFNSAWIATEEGRLKVVVMRVKSREARKKFGDQYIFFKTDNPAAFFPENAGAGRQLDRAAMELTRRARIFNRRQSTGLMKYADDIEGALPPDVNLLALPERIRGEAVGRVLARLSPQLEALPEELIQNTRRLIQSIRSYIEPGINVFSQSTHAVAAFAGISAVANRAESVASEKFAGKVTFGGKGGAVGLLFKPNPRGDSINDALSRIWDKGDDVIKQFDDARSLNYSAARATEEGMDPTIIDLLEKAEAYRFQATDEWMRVASATGHEGDVLSAIDLRNAFFRKGDFAVPIHMEGNPNNIVFYAHGNSREQALNEAKAIVSETRKIFGTKLEVPTDPNRIAKSPPRFDEQVKLHRGAKSESQEALEAALIFRSIARDPNKFAKEFGTLALQQPLDLAVVKNSMYQAIREVERDMARMISLHKYADHFKIVAQSHPALAKELIRRSNAVFGAQSEFNATVTKAVNELGQSVSANFDAAGIVRTVNSGIFNFTLGMGNLGFVVANALTPIQTLLPELALLRTIPAARRAFYYSADLVARQNGSLDMIHSLSPVKTMWQAVKLMRNPTPEFRKAVEDAIKYGVIDKKLIEEFVGENSRIVGNFRDVLKGKQGIVGYLAALSQWAPGKSEEFSRMVSFSAGYLVGKDFFMLEGQRLFNFASQLTNRSMYLYTTADRPRVITGLFGSPVGLFKNWTFHYISNMARYLGEAWHHQNFAPLLWAQAGTFGVAGAGGLAGYSLFNNFVKFATDDGKTGGGTTFTEAVYDGMGYGKGGPDVLTDALFHGFPAFAGVSLQGRSSAPGAQFIYDVNQLFSAAWLDRAITLGQAFGASIDAWEATGSHPIHSQKASDLFLRALAPRTLYAGFSYTEDGAYKSLKSGNRMFNSSVTERVAFTLGISSTHYERQFEAQDILWGKQKALREAVSIAGEAMGEAMREKDVGLQKEILMRSIDRGLPLDSVYRSAKAHLVKGREDMLERQFDIYSSRRLKDVFDLR